MSVSLDIHGTVTDDALAVGVCPKGNPARFRKSRGRFHADIPYTSRNGTHER